MAKPLHATPGRWQMCGNNKKTDTFYYKTKLNCWVPRGYQYRNQMIYMTLIYSHTAVPPPPTSYWTALQSVPACKVLWVSFAPVIRPHFYSTSIWFEYFLMAFITAFIQSLDLKPSSTSWSLQQLITMCWQLSGCSLNLLDGIAILQQKNVIKDKLESSNGLWSYSGKLWPSRSVTNSCV